ncbi:hypothetical protein PENANT_c025G02052 [Penicillium antarcticum]|uniref:Uncharacterized protein n=1 Tax=Penicillium antarcticum TaxID=416450 RepID=A0A1V6PXN9_9EURO|nr:hypothetical protein PENANT_c025G02052 [Penicillium antarcticum]
MGRPGVIAPLKRAMSAIPKPSRLFSALPLLGQVAQTAKDGQNLPDAKTWFCG